MEYTQVSTHLHKHQESLARNLWSKTKESHFECTLRLNENGIWELLFEKAPTAFRHILKLGEIIGSYQS